MAESTHYTFGFGRWIRRSSCFPEAERERVDDKAAGGFLAQRMPIEG